jgi:hypothetical protein
MLKRPSEPVSRSNIKRFSSTASAAYQRSLQSFCNFKQSAFSNQRSAFADRVARAGVGAKIEEGGARRAKG